MSVAYKVDQTTQLGTIIARGKISSDEIIDIIESIYKLNLCPSIMYYGIFAMLIHNH